MTNTNPFYTDAEQNICDAYNSTLLRIQGILLELQTTAEEENRGYTRKEVDDAINLCDEIVRATTK